MPRPVQPQGPGLPPAGVPPLTPTEGGEAAAEAAAELRRRGAEAAAARSRLQLQPLVAEATRRIRELSEASHAARRKRGALKEALDRREAALGAAFDALAETCAARRRELSAELASFRVAAEAVLKRQEERRAAALKQLRAAADTAEGLLSAAESGPEGELLLAVHAAGAADALRAVPQSPRDLGTHAALPVVELDVDFSGLLADLARCGSVQLRGDEASAGSDSDTAVPRSPRSPLGRQPGGAVSPFSTTTPARLGFAGTFVGRRRSDDASATEPPPSPVAGQGRASFSPHGSFGGRMMMNASWRTTPRPASPWRLRLRPADGVQPPRGWIVHRLSVRGECGEELATDPARVSSSGCYAERIGGDRVSRARAAHLAPEPISKPSNVLSTGMEWSWLQMWGAPRGTADAWIEYKCAPGARPRWVTLTTSRAAPKADHVPARVTLEARGPGGASFAATHSVTGRDGPFHAVVEFRIE
eukprot:TRINITY_DN70659_c0_g1_i1.p1 TRINITY_DN70659_c0_g1~~TRINITY_DN70659_c0_g1_i1.p1  ORF type:complete len:497 (+),score=135.48 TRINITY_DN70659_c0_g1_i1:64-1491(+)